MPGFPVETRPSATQPTSRTRDRQFVRHARIGASSPSNEDLDRHLGLPICGMERQLLPGGSSREQNAAVFCGAPFHDGNQLHLSSHPLGKDDRELDGANAGRIFASRSKPRKKSLILRSCAIARTRLAFFAASSPRWASVSVPSSFNCHRTSKKIREALASFLRELPAMRAAFEFRHESWLDEEIFALLREHNVALCIAETGEADHPESGDGRLRISAFTAGRLHQRRCRALGRSRSAGKANWRDAFVYFKHEEAGIGPKLAGEMMGLVG